MSLYKTKFNPFTKKLQFVPSDTIITFKDAVATSASLPTVGNNVNDARVTSDTGHLWVWDGASWIDQGDIIDLEWSAINGKPASTPANIDDAVSKRHTQNTDTILDEGGANEISAEQLRELSLVQLSSLGIIADIEAKLQLPYTVLHTNTDPDSLNTIIQTLNDGDILEVNSSATYNPISIPADKELIIRPSLGKCINLTGTECIKLMNGARDVILAGISIENASSPANNERGAGISFGEIHAKVSNISFYQISIDTVTNGSGVMLSYHWSVGGDTYYTPNTIAECSSDIRFINCCFYKANKDNTEGASVSLRGIINAFIYGCHFRDDAQSMRQIQLQNCINSYIAKNNIRNTATPGTNSEGIKLDDLGSCTFRTTGYIIENVIKNAIEGIDIDDNVTALVFDNICYECTEEGISVDDSAICVMSRNLCYNCRFDGNSAGIRVESGALVSMHQNNCVNNSIDYRIQNGYVLPSGNSTSVDDIILKDSSKNLVYSGSIASAFNVYEALEYLNTYRHTQNTDTILMKDALTTLFDAGILKTDLTADDNIKIILDKLKAKNVTGLEILDSDGNIALKIGKDQNTVGVGIGTNTPDEPLHVSIDENTNKAIKIENLNSGSSAVARMIIKTDDGSFWIASYGTGTVSSGAKKNQGVNLSTSKSGGISVVSQDVAGEIRFYTGGKIDANERMTILANGDIKINENITDGTNKISVSEIIQNLANMAFLAIQRAKDNSLSFYRILQGIVDGYVDETGIDTVNSVNQVYVSGDKLYTNNNPSYGSDITTSGQAISSSDLGGYPKGNAFDNGANIWASGESFAGIAEVSYIGQDFGSVQAIRRFTINQIGDNRMKNAYWEYSDNGSDWTTLQTIVNIPNSDGVQTYNTDNGGSHRYWRIRAKEMWSSRSSWNVTEIEMMVGSGANNMTLISEDFILNNIPNEIRIFIDFEEVSSLTINTDVVLSVSRDGGTTWTECTILDIGKYDTKKHIYMALTDISGQPSDSVLKYKIVTANAKEVKVRGFYSTTK